MCLDGSGQPSRTLYTCCLAWLDFRYSPDLKAGVGKVAGPTGGYLIGFIFMAIVCGLLMQVKKDKKIVNIVFCVVGMLIGTAIAYAFGTMWFCYSTGTGLGAAMALCVIPFIPGDLIKIAIAAVVAPTVANQIKRI